MNPANPNVAASVRARLLNVAKAQGIDFNQVLVRFAIHCALVESLCTQATGWDVREAPRVRAEGGCNIWIDWTHPMLSR